MRPSQGQVEATRAFVDLGWLNHFVLRETGREINARDHAREHRLVRVRLDAEGFARDNIDERRRLVHGKHRRIDRLVRHLTGSVPRDSLVVAKINLNLLMRHWKHCFQNVCKRMQYSGMSDSSG